MHGHWPGDWPNDRVDNWANPMKQNEFFLESAIWEEICALLRAFVPDAEVWAYGSRLLGKAHPGSDLDIVVRTPGELLRPCPAVEVLRAALRESDIPIFVDVHDWALLPEAFQKEIAACFLPLR